MSIMEGSEVVDNFEAHLIELVKYSDFLYDRQSQYYRDPVKFENAWNDIGNVLNVSADKAKRRWITLRQKFARDFKKNALAEKNGSEARSSWPHFKSMEWLADHIHHRRKPQVDEEHSEEWINGEEEECSVPWESEVKERTISAPYGEPAPDFTASAMYGTTDPLDTSSPAPSNSSNVSRKRNRSKRKRSQVNVISHSLCKVSRPSIESPASFPAAGDDISVFSKYLDMNFRALPRECYLKLEFGIQNLLHQAKVEALHGLTD